ncbi:MAG: hypothetical protein ACJ8GN_08125 [Longimicrobiaceae bacterium]
MATLGYHNIGDYHSYVSFPESVRWMGEHADEDFTNPGAFLSLILVVHESYHLFQDLVTGLCCWIERRRDDTLPGASTQGSGLDPFFAGHDRGWEALSEQRLVYSSELTEALVDAEIRAFPKLADLLRPLMDLTGQDILECQAAILTELYIASLVTQRPSAFSPAVMHELAGSWRMELMPGYNRPWELFKQWTAAINFTTANREHPLHRHCPRAAEYALLAFILDMAVHIPPREMLGELDFATELPILQDTAPACRFAKLGMSVVPAMLAAVSKGTEISLVPCDLYRWLAPELEAVVNRASQSARAGNVRKIRRSFLGKLLLRLSNQAGDSRRPTFVGIDATTRGWLEVYRNHPMKSRFPRLVATRMRALLVRLAHPEVLFEMSPLDFFHHVGLPRYYTTSEGVATGLPGLTECPPEQAAEFARWGVPNAGLPAIGSGGDGTLYLAVEPYAFIDEVVLRETTLASLQGRAGNLPLCCPLATPRLGFYPCPSRRPGCASIPALDELPREGCLVRDALETISASPGGTPCT